MNWKKVLLKRIRIKTSFLFSFLDLFVFVFVVCVCVCVCEEKRILQMPNITTRSLPPLSPPPIDAYQPNWTRYISPVGD